MGGSTLLNHWSTCTLVAPFLSDTGHGKVTYGESGKRTWSKFARNNGTALYALLHTDTARHTDNPVTTRPEDNVSVSIGADNALGVGAVTAIAQ